MRVWARDPKPSCRHRIIRPFEPCQRPCRRKRILMEYSLVDLRDHHCVFAASKENLKNIFMISTGHDSNPVPILSRWKKLAFASLIAVLCLVLVEGILNALTLIGALPVNDILSPWFYRPILDRAFFRFDNYGSPIHVNGYKSLSVNGLVGPPVYFDDRGYRLADSSRFMSRNYKIGVFGDSVTAGLQVQDDETFPRLLEQLLESNGDEGIDVYNFGMGGTGTYHQLLRYLTVSEDVDLNLVILAFLPGNDVLNNYRPLGKAYELPGSPYYDAGGNPVRRNEISGGGSSTKARALREWIREYAIGSSFIARAAYFGKVVVQARVFGSSRFGSTHLGVHETPSIEWEKAWKVTEEIILQFATETRNRNDDFIILIVTGNEQIEDAIGTNLSHKGYDYSYPNQRISRFCNSHGLRCYDSLPFFIERGRALNLTYPFFSWKYDGHYAVIGHRTMAEYLYLALQDRHLASSKSAR